MIVHCVACPLTSMSKKICYDRFVMNILYYIKLIKNPKEFIRQVVIKLFIFKVKKSSKFQNKDNFSVRNYKNYDVYINHQKSKFILYRDEFAKGFDEKVIMLKNNFIKIDDFSKQNVLCLGSRDGAEVKAFRDLGALCIGIDLVYPKNSEYVHYGDFHKIPYPDGLFDFVFTNVLDHMYDPKLLFSEIKRVMKNDSIFIAGIIKGYEEGYDLKGEHESYVWADKESLRNLIKENGFDFIKENQLEKSELWSNNLFKLRK